MHMETLIYERMYCSTPKPGRTGTDKPKNCYVGKSAELMTTDTCLERAKEKMESRKKLTTRGTKSEGVAKTGRAPKAAQTKQRQVNFFKKLYS